MRKLWALLGFLGYFSLLSLGFSEGWNGSSVETCLLLVVLIVASDGLHFFNPKRHLNSRTSQCLALGGILISLPAALLGITTHLLGSLFLLPTKRRDWPWEIGVLLWPFTGTAWLAHILPRTPIVQLGLCLVFLFLSLISEPKTLALRSTLGASLAAPAIALSIPGLLALHPLFLILLLPVLAGLASTEDKQQSLMQKMSIALNLSKRKLKEKEKTLSQSRQMISQMTLLMGASQEFASTLEPVEIERIAKKYLTRLGFEASRRVSTLSQEEKRYEATYPLGQEHGFLVVIPKPEGSQKESLELLLRFWSINLENAGLHTQSLHSLRLLKTSQAQLVSQNQLAAVGRLAAGVAHEVNTPLGAIKLSIESGLLCLTEPNEKASKRFGRALEAVERASRSVDRLLHYSRPTESHPPEEFDPATVTRDALELLAHRFESLNVEVTPTLRKGAVLFGVENDYYGLISNLLLNAAEALEGSTKAARDVSISLKHDEQFCYVAVEDSGPGVTPDLREKIFESFFTTKASGKGTGLGLHLVSEIVKNFSGEVSVDQSQELGGARFCVRLPLHQPEGTGAR